MPLIQNPKLLERLVSTDPATPSENVPKGLYRFDVLAGQKGRSDRNDVYLKLELNKLGAPKGERSYTFGKLFKISSSDGRAEQEMADLVAAGAAMGFSAAQLAEIEVSELVGHSGIVGIEEKSGKGGTFSVTGYGAWFRLDTENEITWTPRDNDDDREMTHDEVAEGFRESGRRYREEQGDRKFKGYRLPR